MQVAVSIGEQGYTTQVSARDHTFLADEPSSVGGDDKGMTPYELLMASLGTCTVMTLRMYADRKGWGLEGATCELEFSRVHAKDCQDCVSDSGMISRIGRTLHLKGNLTEAQRARLLEIAERCPVHRTLTGEVMIHSALAQEAMT